MSHAIDAKLAALLPYLPKPVIRRFSARYIAGETLDDALEQIDALVIDGCRATLDLLGEDVVHRRQVLDSVALYEEALAALSGEWGSCGISVKLSELGLRLDPQLCHQAIEQLITSASRRGLFTRIDMEDASLTDATLAIYRDMRAISERTGIVIQARLHRSEADVATLLEDRIAHVRLCKGIYLEPASIAWQRPEEINAAFCRLLDQLLQGGCENVAIATHDPKLVDYACESLQRHAVPRERYEFQMLLGVAQRLRDDLIMDNHPVRVYVPFGRDWLAYSLRRLRENPTIIRHILRNLLPFGQARRRV